jgi:DNA-binding MarR family transcriptional regulator
LYLEATRLLFDELDRRLREEADLPFADYALLARMGDAPEWGLRMSELADTAVYSRSRISHAVDRLERRGWAERRACPTDRRGSYAALTESGRQKLEEARVTHDAVLATHLLGPMSAEEMEGLRVRMAMLKDSLETDGTARLT